MRLLLPCISFVLLIFSGCQSNSSHRQNRIEGNIRNAISQGQPAEVINQLILQSDDPSKAAVAGVWEIMHLRHIPDEIELTWAYYREKPPSSTRSSEIFEVINRYKISVLRVLIQHGVDVNQHYYDRPLVIWAMSEGLPPVTPELLAFLLENGYKPNVEDEQHSPLSFCSKPGESFLRYEQKYDMIKLLLEHGANPNVMSRGSPILHQLVRPDYKENPYQLDIIHLLLDEGADVNVVDKEGRTPLDLISFYQANYSNDALVKSIVDCLKNFGGKRATELRTQEYSVNQLSMNDIR